MTENLEKPNQQQIQKDSRKKQNFLTKIVFLFTVIFFGYLGFKYWQIQNSKKTDNQDFGQKELEKLDNSDTEIFDLPNNHLQQKSEDNSYDLSSLNVSELKEKGAEFVYQMLIKNQLQINNLNQEVLNLKSEVLKYKNREKIGKMIVAYVELRQEFFAQKNYKNNLQNLEVLSVLDENLLVKIEKIKPLLPLFLNKEKLSKNFSGLIPEIIVAKNNNSDNSLISKILRSFSKLIIIRKVDGKDVGDIDSKIFKIEKLLHQENYQEALNLLLSLDQNYHEIIKDFLNDLSVAIEVQKIDQEILNYLKNLT
jgi:preprotein translocase subunit SecG